MTQNTIVDIQGLYKEFNGNSISMKIFDNFDFLLRENQITSIVGPSGCGKTTLLNIISGLDNNYSGAVNNKFRDTIGYIFQNDALIPWKTVSENVLLGIKINNGDSISDSNNDEIMKEFGLYEYKEYYPQMLSGGLRQKVAFAQMLIRKHGLILLDEPFSSQDYFTKIQLENMFYRNLKKRKLAAVLVTHDIDEAIALSDRIIVLSQKPCNILKDITLEFRKDDQYVLPEQVREMTDINNIYSEIYNTLKPELT